MALRFYELFDVYLDVIFIVFAQIFSTRYRACKQVR